jgi:hypothetical protein
MNHEEQDDLWELLGKARQPSVSPFFARNVLREVRGMELERTGLLSGLRSWFPRHWRAFAISACTACFAFVAVLYMRNYGEPKVENQQILAMAERVSASPDYQVINHLDELLDSEKNSVWLDNGTSTY